jgi:hypothetical protein
MKKIISVIIFIVSGIMVTMSGNSQTVTASLYDFNWNVAGVGGVNQGYNADLVLTIQPGGITKNASFKTVNNGNDPY